MSTFASPHRQLCAGAVVHGTFPSRPRLCFDSLVNADSLMNSEFLMAKNSDSFMNSDPVMASDPPMAAIPGSC